MKLDQLTDKLHKLFLPYDLNQDYGPNGLQSSGSTTINKVTLGVTACKKLIEKSIELKSDAIIVHHGCIKYSHDLQPTVDICNFQRLRYCIHIEEYQ